MLTSRPGASAFAQVAAICRADDGSWARTRVRAMLTVSIGKLTDPGPAPYNTEASTLLLSRRLASRLSGPVRSIPTFRRPSHAFCSVPAGRDPGRGRRPAALAGRRRVAAGGDPGSRPTGQCGKHRRRRRPACGDPAPAQHATQDPGRRGGGPAQPAHILVVSPLRGPGPRADTFGV